MTGIILTRANETQVKTMQVITGSEVGGGKQDGAFKDRSATNTQGNKENVFKIQLKPHTHRKVKENKTS